MYFLLMFFQGRSYCVRTQRMLNQCLESLVQKVLSGVVINFEKTGPDPPPVGEGMHPGIGTSHCYYDVIRMNVDYMIFFSSITYSQYLFDTQERKKRIMSEIQCYDEIKLCCNPVETFPCSIMRTFDRMLKNVSKKKNILYVCLM